MTPVFFVAKALSRNSSKAPVDVVLPILPYFPRMNSCEDVRAPRPEIIENYRDFEPPPPVKEIISILLDCVSPNYLRGLKAIILANQTALTRNKRRQKIWSRNRKIRLAEARGAYYRATRSSPAVVWLYVDNILKGTPAWTLKVPIARYAEFGEVLYHEIGHHIHAAHEPVHEGKENVAEDWSKRLSHQFFRKHYWYMVPFRYPMLFLVNAALRIMEVLRRRRRDGSESNDPAT